MGRDSSRIFNIISIVFVLLSIVWIIFVVMRLLSPVSTAAQVANLPPELVIPTQTPTNVPPPTLPPTFTFTPTDTRTPTVTPTATASITASPTITETPGPTLTPSVTFTPSISPTFTPTFTPTGPTETFTPTTSPFLYDLRDQQVILTQNTFNTAGCAWQGFAGQVYDTTDVEKNTSSGLQVHVFDISGVFDQRTQVGSNSTYGISGWEIRVDNKINTLTYFVQLESAAGTEISPRLEVTFPGDCARNVALVRFKQLR